MAGAHSARRKLRDQNGSWRITKTATFTTVPIEQIREWPGNPRRHFDEAKLNDLAESIKAQGILQPIVVRPCGDKLEIVCGARRYRAAKIAGLSEIPAVVRSLTDKEVLELAVIENLQREDVHPLEEAEGYKRLIAEGYDVDALAGKVGKSTRYVYQRMQLEKLSDEAKEEFANNTISAGHAVLLCRLSDADQHEVLTAMLWERDYDYKSGKFKRLKTRRNENMLSVRALRSEIRQLTHPLKEAIFDREDAGLTSAPKCSLCPKRTQADRLALYEDDELAKEDRCLDNGCFLTKHVAHLKQIHTRFSKEQQLPVHFVHGSRGNLPLIFPGIKRILKEYDGFVFSKTGDALGIDVVTGKARSIALEKQRSSTSSSGYDPAEVKRKKELEERRNAIQRDWRVAMQEELKKVVSAKIDIDFVRAYALEKDERLYGQSKRAVYKRMGWSELSDRAFAKEIADLSEEKLMLFLFYCDTEPEAFRPQYGYSGGPSRLLKLCELHNIDADALKKAAEKKFPKPPPVQTSAKPAKEAKKK